MSSRTPHTHESRRQEELLSVPEAARLIGRSVRRVYDYVSTGLLPSTVIAGKLVVRRSDVERFVPPSRRDKRR